VLDGAYRGYRELNLQCMKLTAPGGFLVTCSCSQFMTPELFLKMLREAAADSGRRVRLLESLLQSRDHPAALGGRAIPLLKGLYSASFIIIRIIPIYKSENRGIIRP
jgi:23S rRNA (cytosine1962-C5)-methyltransferase